MNKEEIMLAKREYKKLTDEVEKLKRIKSRVLELEEDPKVKEYLKLVHTIKHEDFKFKRNNVHDSFYKIAANTKDSNQLLVYMGAYKIDNLYGVPLLTDSNESDFMVFEDLETGQVYQINPDEKDEFYKTHKVIYLPIEEENVTNYKNEFIKLRNSFFKELLEKDQNEVVKQFKNKRN